MTVKLMLTCLCDAFYGEVGIATVRVLEHAGCTVEFPDGQTCCGQPAFNAGDWAATRKVAKHWLNTFAPDQNAAIQNPKSKIQDPVVTPSSSCAAMIREGYHLLFPNQHPTPNTFELSEFLANHLHIEKWPLTFTPRPTKTTRIAYHRACHGRGLGLKDEQEKLLASIPGIELVPIAQPEQCCGFGGAFSVGHPTVSAGIGDEKLRNVLASGANILVSGDMGCLMHLRGLIQKEGLALQTKHFAEILADAIPAKVPA